MRCKFCGYDIPAEDIDLSQRLAKCRGCNEVFALDVPQPAIPLQLPISTPIDLPARPEKLKVVDENGQGYMQWRWFRPIAILLLFFCFAWDGILISVYSRAFFAVGVGNAAQAPVDWFRMLFPLVHVVAGVGLTYYTICLFLNKTQIVYDGVFFLFRSGPVPTLRSHSYSKEEIKEFESEVTIASGKSTMHTNYRLFVVLSNNTRKTLIYYETDMGLIRYVQRQLEAWLKLPAGRCIK